MAGDEMKMLKTGPQNWPRRNSAMEQSHMKFWPFLKHCLAVALHCQANAS